MGDVFYTEEQKERLRGISEDMAKRNKPLSEATGAAILDALGEQQNTMLAILDEFRKLSGLGICVGAETSSRARLEKFVQSIPDEIIGKIEEAFKLIWK